MQRTGFDLEIKEDLCGVNMTYHFIHDYVTYDPDRLQKAAAEQKVEVGLETYITAITLHEIGHAIDRQALLDSIPQSVEVMKMKQGIPVPVIYADPVLLGKLIEEDERNLICEKTAWENASMLNNMYQLVPFELFNAIAEQSLGTYETKLTDKKRRLARIVGTATA
ncbi:integrase [Bhargavaea ullalensis]|uniref:Uncharacterized protein n=1 Tax=Bhargavaea ullalensis TaxID=1265685 RepID=A0ABV2GA97_9BACL